MTAAHGLLLKNLGQSFVLIDWDWKGLFADLLIAAETHTHFVKNTAHKIEYNEILSTYIIIALHNHC